MAKFRLNSFLMIWGLFSPLFSFTQNLVMNPDFEEFTQCPTNVSEFNYYEYHIEPGQNLQLFFSYKDSLADSISIENFGNIFSLTNPATFNTINNQNEIYSFFNWTPDSNAVKSFPYIVNFLTHSKIDTTDIYHYITVLIYVENNLNEIEEISLSSFLIYPNPTTDKITLSTDITSLYTFKIYNTIGEIVYTGSFQSTNTIDVSKWSNGIYFIRYSDGENTGCMKIMKE